jgi:hypothetical protein
MKLLSVIIFLAAFQIQAQELNCKVTVNYESLPVVNREYLANFASDVEDYMNRVKFTGDTWDVDKIDCSINIIFLAAASETNYSAQAVVVSRRPVYNSTDNSLMLVINDNTWNFSYQRGQSFQFTTSSFDPLLSFLDFYAFVILGYDFDSYEQLGGTRYYNEAIKILNMGATGSFSAGWTSSSGSYNRKGFIEDVLQEKYRPFREAFFDYHYNGLDMFTKQRDAALQNMAKIVFALNDLRGKLNINSVLIKTFFDGKHGELIQYMKLYSDPEIFTVLKKVDPGHAAKYDEAMTRK